MEVFKELLEPQWIWLIVGLLLILSEFVLPGLLMIFFGLGACIVSGICFYTEISVNIQLGVFLATSVVSLLFLRKYLKSLFLGHVTDTQSTSENLAGFLGQKAIVKQTIIEKIGGKIEFHGTNWHAEAEYEIAEGTPVEIIGKDSLTLKVKKL
jgi:membrane protein implicated in regulation of membrane protease activity